MIKISDTEYFSNDKTIRFLNMDCNEFMAQCKENEFDLNLSDPPYGINAHKKMGVNKKKGYDPKPWAGGEWDNKVPTKDLFNNLFKTSKNQIIFGGNYFDLPPTRCFLIWDKMQRIDQADCEMAWTSFKSSARIFQYWNSKLIGFMNPDRFHPTEKPIDLYDWILSNYTKPTDTILDCFGGSMSNAIACHMKRRKLTIIELDVDYFKSALKRFEIYERQVEDIKEFGYAKTKINAQNPVLF